MRKAFWLSEYSITQTKIKVENGSLLNLSGDIARWTNTEVKWVMERVIWNPSLSRDDTGRVGVPYHKFHFNFIKCKASYEKKLNQEAFVLGLLIWNWSWYWPCLANLRQTHTWWDGYPRLKNTHAICRFLNQFSLLKQNPGSWLTTITEHHVNIVGGLSLSLSAPSHT